MGRNIYIELPLFKNSSGCGHQIVVVMPISQTSLHLVALLPFPQVNGRPRHRVMQQRSGLQQRSGQEAELSNISRKLKNKYSPG